jgi:hypothetical protein
LAERTWQTITSTARALLTHARIPDSFWYHALCYSTYIFNVLPVRGLRDGDTDSPATPHELFFGSKPRISHYWVFGCPVIIHKWTSSDNTNGKQTERGIRGIFIGFDTHQKGYVIYCPGSHSIVISDDVLFNEQFTSAIALTWQKFHDGLALRPLASFIPDITTTTEQTGTLADFQPQVEEGTLINVSDEADPDDDGCPDLTPQTADDDDSDNDDDSTSTTPPDTDDDLSLTDDYIVDLLDPTPPEPEPEMPQVQPIRRSTRP